MRYTIDIPDSVPEEESAKIRRLLNRINADVREEGGCDLVYAVKEGHVIKSPNAKGLQKKLTDADIAEIKADYAEKRFTMADIADVYEVSRTTIWKVVTGKYA